MSDAWSNDCSFRISKGCIDGVVHYAIWPMINQWSKNISLLFVQSLDSFFTNYFKALHTFLWCKASPLWQFHHSLSRCICLQLFHLFAIPEICWTQWLAGISWLVVLGWNIWKCSRLK